MEPNLLHTKKTVHKVIFKAFMMIQPCQALSLDSGSQKTMIQLFQMYVSTTIVS